MATIIRSEYDIIPTAETVKVKSDNNEHYGDLYVEYDALDVLNNCDSVTINEACKVLSSLCLSVDDKSKALSEKVIGTFSYYEGLRNGMLIGLKLLNKMK